MSSWYVYIVRCNDGTLYTGITKDLERRLAEHNSPKGGAKYTRTRKPVTLVYFEEAESRSAAASREYRLKQMSTAQKHALLADFFEETARRARHYFSSLSKTCG